MARSLWDDEVGFILSAELVLILTVGVLALVVGLHQLAKSINGELIDLASAIGNLSQSYTVNGFKIECSKGWGCNVLNAAVSGSGFIDEADQCDCAVLIHVPPTHTTKTQGGPGTG